MTRHLSARRRLPAAAALAAALLSALLASCGGGAVDPFLERPIAWGPQQRAVELAAGASVDVPVRICPAVRSYEVDAPGSAAVSFQPGRYALAVENLPPDVSASFPDGAERTVGEPVVGGLGRPGIQPGLPWAGAYSEERYCWQQTLRLARGSVTGALPARELQLRLTIRYESTRFVTLAADETRREPISLRLVDAAAGSPPVAGATCTAGAAAPGRWVDAFAAPPLLDGASGGELDATLVQDRPLIGRVARGSSPTGGFDLVADEWVGDGWRRTRLATAAGADQVRVAAWRDPSDGTPRRIAAWRSVDFTAPREEQARVRAAWIDERGTWTPLATDAGSGFESEVRSLQLAAWQGRPVVGWLRPTGLVLQRFDGSAWQSLQSPVDAAYDGSTRQLRLRVDPADDALVLAFAGIDRDGVTRLRAWRLARPGDAWIALPALEAGAPQGLGAGLAAFALDALDGGVTLAWSYGQVSFSAASQLAMSVQRLARGAAAWAPLGDARTLADPASGYGVQPVTMALAPSCSGGAFLAWHEPGNYPEGRIAGAQWAAASGWDPFGRTDLATLPGGRGTYSADLRLLPASDGRPLLVAVLQPATGGPAQVVLRRHAP